MGISTNTYGNAIIIIIRQELTVHFGPNSHVKFDSQTKALVSAYDNQVRENNHYRHYYHIYYKDERWIEF